MMSGIWCVVMIVTLIVEIATTGTLVSIWFTIGGLAALLLSLFNVPYLIQIVVFIVISTICILLFRPLASKVLRGNITATNADRLIGKHYRLIKEIKEEEWGEINVNGVVWHVTSYNGKAIAKDTLVTVLAIEGAKLIVKAID